MNNTTSSPLDTPYNRLDEVHRAWHGALNGYHKIEDFRANINTAIQALRNLTFALQSQKNNLSNFDSWYAEWQEKMINNFILNELKEARNIIVKQEDLVLHSIAIARTKGWVDFQKTSFSFDPLSDSLSVAKGFYDVYAKYLPVADDMKKRLVFEFERKWVYEKIPDRELLEVIAEAYYFFYKMLKDASQKFSIPLRENLDTLSFCSNSFNNEEKLKCMIITPQERCLIFSFENGEIIKTHTETIDREQMNFKKTEERYGNEWKSEDVALLLDDISLNNEYPFNMLKTFIQVAISALKKDKSLIPISFILSKNEKDAPKMIAHPFTNQESKLLSMDNVATAIIKENGKYVITIAETWIYLNKGEKTIIPSENNTRDTKEAIQINCFSADKLKIITIPFHKNILNKIFFSKPEVEDFSTDINDHNCFIILPLIKALRQVNE